MKFLPCPHWTRIPAGVVSSRRVATALIIGLGSLSSSPIIASSQCSPRRLLASREQIDLAVQASSVKAWSAASEAASDKALDPASLAAAFDACTADSPDDWREFVSGVADLRKQLQALGERDDADAEQAMRAMRTGTMTRNAIDRYTRIAGIADG